MEYHGSYRVFLVFAAAHAAAPPAAGLLLYILHQPNTAATAGDYRCQAVASLGSPRCLFAPLQLAELMEALRRMEPHYIRCIKPNSYNRPMDFESLNVLLQVRGVGCCPCWPDRALHLVGL